MASKKKGQMVKQCRIFQWLEAQDPELAGAVRELCLDRLLEPPPGHGVTFLYPQEKAYRDEIVDATYSADPESAIKLVESLIIPDALPKGADFKKRPIGSRLGVRYAVESAEAGTVRLAGGVELVPAKNFSPFGRREHEIAVWAIAKGRLPLVGEAYTAPPRAERRGAKGGRAVRGGANGALNNRQLLAGAAETEFDRCMRQDRCRAHNPYLAKVVSFLNYLKARHPDLLLTLMPVLDYDPVVCFYLLFEPYKSVGEYLVPEEVLFGDGAWNGAEAFGNAVEEYKAIFAAIPREQAPTATDPATGQPAVPYVFRDHAAIAAQIDLVRRQFGALNPRQGPQMVQDTYAALAAHNTIGGVGPVLPDTTLRALAGSKKLWQDEFRFIIHEALQTMRATPYTTDLFGSIVRDLRYAWPGDNYGRELRLSNVEDIRASVAPRDTLLLLGKFVYSTDFLYLAPPPEAVGEAAGSPTNPTDWEVYNRNAAALANLGQAAGMVRASGLSPQALQELQVYAKIHGQLPPEVMALARPS
jgi:hypothetical protein